MGSGIGRVTEHPDYYLSPESVSFLTTENTLFRVHKFFFERESEFFSNLFLTAAKEDPQAGTDARPFKLDVTADEFSQFLWVWYDRDYCYRYQTTEHWTTVLQLATLWEFPKIKALAIRELDALDFSPAERISLYNKHGIENDQLFTSYVELCKSPTLPSEADGRLMQMETLINILQAREDAQQKAAELGHESPTSASLEDMTLREVVSKFFKKGLSPRSNGSSTGSEAQASSLNGERIQETSTRTTITLEEPQVPDRKAHPTGEGTPQSNSSLPVDEGRGSREKPSGNVDEKNNIHEKAEGENPRTGEATWDKEREEKEKQEKARVAVENEEKMKREEQKKDAQLKERAQPKTRIRTSGRS